MPDVQPRRLPASRPFGSALGELPRSRLDPDVPPRPQAQVRDFFTHNESEGGGVLKPEDFEALLKLMYEYGGNPEYVYGKCPTCGEPFVYELGVVLQGHIWSQCPKREEP